MRPKGPIWELYTNDGHPTDTITQLKKTPGVLVVSNITNATILSYLFSHPWYRPVGHRLAPIVPSTDFYQPTFIDRQV